MDKANLNRLAELSRLSQGLPTARKPDEILKAEAALAKRRLKQAQVEETGVEEPEEEIPA